MLVALVLAVVAIYPNFTATGVAIRSVERNSTASLAGMQSPDPTIPPTARERILAINNIVIKDMDTYYTFISDIKINQSLTIKTTRDTYRLIVQPEVQTTILNQTELKTIEEIVLINETVNGTVTLVNKTINKTIRVPKTETKILGVKDLGLNVYDAPTTNIRKGLDLQGGTRVLLQPAEPITPDELSLLLENMKYRLNVFGLSDVVVRDAGDLSGNQYILVEVAGANEEEVKELMSRQGKFESKVGNNTVFKGGNDITYVCRSADCAGIDPTAGCGTFGGGWSCRFSFAISLSPEAAERQANLTKDLSIVTEGTNSYLSEKLFLYLDDQAVDELNIGSDLRGRAVTDIQISGSGAGASEQEAIFDALKNMKRLQTILITGSLPVSLTIVKTDNISPVLGEEFIKNALFIGALSIMVVSIIIFLRYKKFEVAVPIIFTMIAELILLLGIAALIGSNLDLAAIAGIIVAIGTGVNDQIVIADETLYGEKRAVFNWKQRIKNAFFIIFAAYFTLTFAMVPLIFAGAGLLKGFAITTILGISIGVFITRPAYAATVEILLKE